MLGGQKLAAFYLKLLSIVPTRRAGGVSTIVLYIPMRKRFGSRGIK